MIRTSGKIWGLTGLIFENHNFELHRIEAKNGGICSKHKHVHKYNGIFVESGRLLVRVWKNDYDLIDETIVTAGECCIIKPLEYHQFEALKDTIAFEWYWAEFDPKDIEREDHGSILPNYENVSRE